MSKTEEDTVQVPGTHRLRGQTKLHGDTQRRASGNHLGFLGVQEARYMLCWLYY